MFTFDQELENLRGDGSKERQPLGVEIILQVRCRDQAPEVLAKVQHVLTTVTAVSARGEWPSRAVWLQELPKWFVEACRPEQSKEEVEEWFERWRRLSPEEQARSSAQKRWALSEWLYWFAPGPDERQWRWSRAEVVSDDVLQVYLAAEGWPTAYGALKWLFRAPRAQECSSSSGSACSLYKAISIIVRTSPAARWMAGAMPRDD